MTVAMKNTHEKIGGQSLVPPSFTMALAHLLEFGAKKYAAWDWLKGNRPMSDYLDAIERHKLALVAGEDIDPESGVHHAAAIGFSAMVLVEAYYAELLGLPETMRVIDNRSHEPNRMLTPDQMAAALALGRRVAAGEIASKPVVVTWGEPPEEAAP